MEGVALLLGAAAAAHLAARGLRLPAIPFLLLAGLGLSLTAPPAGAVLEDALVLGVVFLLFIAGLELDPRRVRAQRRAAVRVGVVQFVALGGLGFAASELLGFTALESAYLALALTASSTLLGVRLLKRRQQMFEPFGRLVLGTLLVQDLLVLAAIPVVTRLGEGWGWGPALEGLGAIAVLAGACLAVRRWVAPLLLEVSGEGEMVLLSSLTVLFAFLGGAGALDVPVVVGAFLAGVALARFPVNGVVRSELLSIGDFFAALFFTALGARVGVPSATELWQAGVLAALVLAVTPPLVTVVAERAGLAARSSVEAGLMLAQTSEISLVVGLAGMLAGDVGSGAFTVIALVTMVTMLLTPVLATDEMAWRLVRLHPTPGGRPGPVPPPRDHVLLLGCGSTGQRLLDMLLLAGCEVVVVDEDPAVVDQLRETGARVVRGDGSDPRVVQRAGAERARVVVSTMRRADDARAVLEAAAGEVPVLVRVFEEEDARWVRALGGRPVLASRLAAASLMEWRSQAPATSSSSSSPSRTSPSISHSSR